MRNRKLLIYIYIYIRKSIGSNHLARFFKKLYYGVNARKIANNLYKKRFGRSIDWHHPKEFNEKIRYIQFNTDTSKWVLLADKFRVREYLTSVGMGSILVDLYGKWDKVSDIKFDSLPNSFVLKTNNGCGDIIVVKDKTQIDRQSIISILNRNLHSIFGLNSAQIHYSQIKGCIIAEELLENDAVYSNCIVDYKFFCFNGEPRICGVFYDRQQNTHATNSTFYDMDWVKHDEWRATSIKTPSKDIPRPARLNELIDICKQLTKDFPFVRLDFYYINNRIYFGEFTFTPAACDGGSLNEQFFDEFGSWIHV